LFLATVATVRGVPQCQAACGAERDVFCDAPRWEDEQAAGVGREVLLDDRKRGGDSDGVFECAGRTRGT